jgi:tetratricopeptide (TPR) repeat protein
MSMLENRGQVNLLLGYYDKALEDFKKLAGMAASRGENELEARARHLRGKSYFQRARQGDFDRAIEHFSLAAGKLKDSLLLAEILNDRARTHLEKGERDKALDCLEKTEQIFTRVAGSPLSVQECIFKASLLRNRGSVFQRKGEFSRAIGIYRDALELVSDDSEPRLKKIRAMLLNSIGLSLMKAFKLEESLQYFKTALKLAGSIGDLKTEIQVRINMGVVDNDMGRNQEALETLSAQHETLEVLVGETKELAALQFNIGESYMFLEKYEESEPWYRRALNIGERIGYKEFVVSTRYNLAEVLHITGRSAEALEVLEPAYEMAREGNWNLQLMDISNLLGEIKRRNGDFPRALDYHNEALKISRRLKDDFGKSWALRNLALDILADPGSEQAEAGSCGELLEESVELARKAGQPENLMYSLRELIRWKLDKQQHPHGAVPLYEELKAQAKKVGSRSFSEFCKSVRNRLGGKKK